MSTLTAPTNILTSTSAVTNLFCVALDWMFWLLIVLSIAFALVAAYMYVTSNGDSEKVGKATKTLTYVAIAIVVALMAKGLPLVVGSIISPSTNLNACGGSSNNGGGGGGGTPSTPTTPGGGGGGPTDCSISSQCPNGESCVDNTCQ